MILQLTLLHFGILAMRQLLLVFFTDAKFWEILMIILKRRFNALFLPYVIKKM